MKTIRLKNMKIEFPPRPGGNRTVIAFLPEIRLTILCKVFYYVQVSLLWFGFAMLVVYIPRRLRETGIYKNILNH